GNAFDFDLSGTLRMTAMTVTDEAATLYATVAGAKAVSRVPDSQSAFDKVAAQVQSGGYFLTLSGGRLTEMRVPQGAAPTVVNVYREIASALQFARPAGESTRYRAEEYDTTGKYVAAYQLDRAQSLWQKTKERYVSLLAPKAPEGKIPARILPEIIS